MLLFGFGQYFRAQRVPKDQFGFTAYMLQQFRKAMPKSNVQIHDLLVLTIGSEESGLTVNLDNIYRTCSRHADSCEQEAADFAAQITALHQTPEPPLQRAMLRVIVRPEAYLDEMRRDLAPQGGPVVLPLSEGLWIVIVFDLPTAIRMANVRDVEQLGLSAAEALSLAKENMLDSLREQIEEAKGSHDAGIMVLTGDPYGSSLFAFPEIWAPLAEAFHGHLVAALPSSDTIVCADASIPGMTAKVPDIARQIAADAWHPYSDAVFQWTPAGWTPLASPSPPH